MVAAVIIDAIVTALLAVFVCLGWRRGLFRALAGLLILLIALAGAGMAANYVSEPAAQLLAPLMEGRVEEKLKTAIEELDLNPKGGQESELVAWLEEFGLDPKIYQEVLEEAREAMVDATEAVIAALTQELTRSLIYGVVFLIVWILLMVVLHLMAQAVDLFLHLPVLRGANALGGAVVGALEGALLMFLFVWIAKKLGLEFIQNPVWSQTYLFQFFMTHTPLSAWSLLQ